MIYGEHPRPGTPGTWQREIYQAVGRMVAWRCGARTAYFELQDEPTSTVCPACLINRHDPEQEQA